MPELNSPNTTEGVPAYLVLVQPELVAQDIALTISDYQPNAEVILVRSPTEAMLALERLASVVAAFLGMDPAVFEESELAAAIRARGAKVIMIGEAAEAAQAGPGWRALMRPFSSDTVIATLAEDFG